MRSRGIRILQAACAVMLCAGLVATSNADTDSDVASSQEIAVEGLFSDAPGDLSGKTMTVVEVTYPPLSSMPIHRHPGSVFVYVVSGTVRSQLGTDAEPVVYHAGESWFEPPGAQHVFMDNPSESEPARILAVMFSGAEEELVIPDDAG